MSCTRKCGNNNSLSKLDDQKVLLSFVLMYEFGNKP